MKTFRLQGLHLLLKEEEELQQEQVKLQEGLVINREEGGWWLLEAVIDEPSIPTFQRLSEKKSEVVMDVLISHKQNDPATMVGRVRSIRELNERYAILIDSKMALKKEDIFNYIMESLIQDGYTGDELLTEFKNRKQDRASWSAQLARSLYKQYEEQGQSPLDDAK
ncbi:YwpF family protein [Natribacillus halophilus]|uniref:YwpF-like protein n=1 Tax=Natribacillus halophilus TaxID=549003 RepID=A0A1G8NJW2_9BACI|nr:YwpF family protein [Natribacillus halophilus]SDI80549.1 YwpF-like protein [Natribacillus halophilus]